MASLYGGGDMALYHVTYYYLATGMEGRSQREDYGVVEADSPRAAMVKAVDQHHPGCDKRTRDFILGCLSARRAHAGGHDHGA